MYPYVATSLMWPAICPLPTYYSTLHSVSHHDNTVDFLLPYHPPEVAHGAWQRTLRGDVLLPGVETLQQWKHSVTSGHTPRMHPTGLPTGHTSRTHPAGLLDMQCHTGTHPPHAVSRWDTPHWSLGYLSTSRFSGGRGLIWAGL